MPRAISYQRSKNSLIWGLSNFLEKSSFWNPCVLSIWAYPELRLVNVRPSKNNGLDKERHVNLKQMRAVDISRIKNRQGILESQYLKPIQEVIEIIFSL